MTSAIERTQRYQDDLARLLAALEPAERAEVLDSVREHIDAALAEVEAEPTDEDVNRILSGLGSPGAVAEAALAERPDPAPSVLPSSRGYGDAWREQLMRRWVPPTVTVGLFLVGLVSISPAGWLPLAALIALLICSSLWTVPEKVIGALVPSIGLPMATIGIITGADRVLIPGLVLLPAALAVLVLIGIRGGRRAAQHARATAASPTWRENS
ncbi:HAAS signaling domain-containing protein [Ruania halotolerans]|uniref:HAAS signaling domain-containing protein n=1 Tax=Ruania halotolerans TaxID=2897773 RepID=UPI001E458D1E|nr:hypothetical protein [Ruania halotolerans]UFU05697.1 hypothetical protein LQF10_14800 [Ruania halotolerans]